VKFCPFPFPFCLQLTISRVIRLRNGGNDAKTVYENQVFNLILFVVLLRICYHACVEINGKEEINVPCTLI